MRIYALFAYAGLSMMVLGGARILDPYFEMLPGGVGSVVSFGAQAALFVCGAEWILKPAFEDQKKKKNNVYGEEKEDKGKSGGKKKSGGADKGNEKSKRIRKRKGKGRNKKRF